MQSNHTNVKYHNEQSLNQWLQDYQQFPAQIEQAKNELQQAQATLYTAKKECQTFLDSEYQPVVKRVHAIHAQIETFNLPFVINELQNRRPTLEQLIEQYKPQIAAINSQITPIEATIKRLEKYIRLHELNAAITQLTAKWKEFRQTAERHEAAIKSLSSEIDILQNAISSLTQQKIATPEYIQTQANAVSSDYYSSQSQASDYSSSGAHVAAQESIENPAYTLLQQNIGAAESSLQKARNRLQKERILLNKAKTNANLCVAEKEAVISKVNQYSASDQQLLHAAEYSSIEKLRRDLASTEQEKRDLQNQKEPLEINLNATIQKLKTLDEQIKQKKADLVRAYHDSRDYKDIDLEKLEDMLATDTKARDALLVEKNKKEIDVQDKQYATDNKQKNLDSLEGKFAAAQNNRFMQDFWHQPTNLIKSLNDDVQAALDLYEKTHPANQSMDVRYALTNIPTQLKYITDKKIEPSFSDYQDFTQKNDMLKGEQAKYIQLCAVLRLHLRDLEIEKEREPLAKVLKDLLEIHAIEGEYASAILRPVQSELPIISPCLITEKETQAYNKAREDLDALAQEIKNEKDKPTKNLYKTASLLLKLVEANKAKDENNFDYKYYTHVLTTAEKLARQSGNVNLQTDFLDLLHAAPENKSASKMRFRGAGLMLLGACIVIGSVIASIVASATAPLLSPIIIKVGAGSAAFGSGIFAIGAILYSLSFKKDIKRTMEDYSKAVRGPTFFNRGPSAPPVEKQEQSADLRPRFA